MLGDLLIPELLLTKCFTWISKTQKKATVLLCFDVLSEYFITWC